MTITCVTRSLRHGPTAGSLLHTDRHGFRCRSRSRSPLSAPRCVRTRRLAHLFGISGATDHEDDVRMWCLGRRSKRTRHFVNYTGVAVRNMPRGPPPYYMAGSQTTTGTMSPSSLNGTLGNSRPACPTFSRHSHAVGHGVSAAHRQPGRVARVAQLDALPLGAHGRRVAAAGAREHGRVGVKWPREYMTRRCHLASLSCHIRCALITAAILVPYIRNSIICCRLTAQQTGGHSFLCVVVAMPS